jgi:HSP20 family molecular chaperone IbpA
MIPSEPNNENEKGRKPKNTAGQAGEAISSARWFHWEISTTRSFPTARDVEKRFEERQRRWRAPQAEPPADVFVIGSEIVVQMDLPGVEEGDVRARIEGDSLVVEATRHMAPPSERARPTHLERPRGPLRRRVPLPAVPPPARLDLEMRSGVLLLRIVPEQEQ